MRFTLHVRVVSLLAVSLILGALWPLGADGESQPVGKGMIEGRVIHQAEEAEALSDVVVTLHIFRDRMPLESIREVTDTDGRFRFEGLDTCPDNTYVVATEFGGVLYFGERVVFGEAARAESDLIVYDTTTDDSALGVVHEHMILAFRPGAIEISEVIVIGNKGNRTVVSRELPGGERGTLRITLPERAFALEELQGLRGVDSTKVSGGIAYDSPIIPATAQVAFRYMLPYRGPTTVARQLDYPTEVIDLLVQEAAVDVAIEGLQAKPAVSIGGQQYFHFRGSDLARGAGITVTVGAISGHFTRRTFLALVLACTAGLAAVGYVYPFVRRGRRPGVRSEEREPRWVSRYRESAEGQSLVREMAELDDLHHEGQIAEADYRRRRQAKKKRLVSVLDR